MKLSRKKIALATIVVFIFILTDLGIVPFTKPVLTLPGASSSSPLAYTDTLLMTLPPSLDSCISGWNAGTIPEAQCGIPTEVTWTPDGRALLTEKEGRLFVYADQQLTMALDLSNIMCVEGERALGGLVVHPNFAVNHYIYLWYNYQKFGTCNTQSPDGPVNRLSRFILLNNNIIDPASEVVLLDTPPPPWYFHNGGDLKFGHDGYLYITVGEGGSDAYSTSSYGEKTAAEDPGLLLGKILRLTDSGGIPLGNPFNGPDSARCNANGVVPTGSSATKCQEVFAMGLRNPFKFSFDPNTRSVRSFINDVGEDTWEEVDELKAGANYGWPTREGPCAATSPPPTITDCGPPPPGLTNPVYWYMHDNTTVTWNGSPVSCGAAITGAAFVPNGLLGSPLDGTYLYGDYDCGGIWSVAQNSTAPSGYSATLIAQVLPSSSGGGLTSMRFAPYGNTQGLYYVNGVNYGRSPGELHVITFSGSADGTALTQNFVRDWADYFNTGNVTIRDLVRLGSCFGSNPTYPSWAQCSYFDITQRGRVDITDLATMAGDFGSASTLGKGQPTGTLDPSWKPQCGLLPLAQQFYCNNLP